MNRSETNLALAPMAPEETGNTNKSPPKKRTAASKKWCFTLHNYSQEDIGSLIKVFEKLGKYFFAEELGKSEETPHLQGFVVLDKKGRPFEWALNREIHWEKMKGTVEENVKYCNKEHKKCYTNCDDFIIEEIHDPLAGKKMKEWQQKVLDLLEEEPDRRTIHWFWEPNGNVGKTCLAFHICLNHKRAIYCTGKSADMKFAIAKMKRFPKICILDFVRTSEDYISYEGIEAIKNGIFFCGKYESEMVMGNPPHVICFANFEPDVGALSDDRWKITKI